MHRQRLANMRFKQTKTDRQTYRCHTHLYVDVNDRGCSGKVVGGRARDVPTLREECVVTAAGVGGSWHKHRCCSRLMAKGSQVFHELEGVASCTRKLT